MNSFEDEPSLFLSELRFIVFIYIRFSARARVSFRSECVIVNTLAQAPPTTVSAPAVPRNLRFSWSEWVNWLAECANRYERFPWIPLEDYGIKLTLRRLRWLSQLQVGIVPSCWINSKNYWRTSSKCNRTLRVQYAFDRNVFRSVWVHARLSWSLLTSNFSSFMPYCMIASGKIVTYLKEKQVQSTSTAGNEMIDFSRFSPSLPSFRLSRKTVFLKIA